MVKFNIQTVDRNDDLKKTANVILPTESNTYKQFYAIKEKVPTVGYNEMYKYAKDNLVFILKNAIDKNPEALQIIIDKDFLIGMEMCELEELNRDNTIKYNRIFRAYVKNENSSPDIIHVMECNAKKINKRLYMILLGLGLTEKDAIWLAVNRYSSTEERRNVRRLTREMQHIDKSIMTEQMIVDIYSKTFSDQLTNLFCSVMTDRFTKFIDENEEYVYSTVSNALLDILEQMPYADIESILVAYINELNASGLTGRFYLNSINSIDWPRINRVIDKLDSMGYDFL